MIRKTESHEFGKISTLDAMNWFIGSKIGEGQYRDVYEYELDKRFVVKFEWGIQCCNTTEYLIWEELRATPLGKWLAPVWAISAGGFWMMQKRCEPIGLKDRPTKVPEFFTDLKADNWGLLNGKPVCFDYGNHRLFTAAAKRSKLKTAKWLK